MLPLHTSGKPPPKTRGETRSADIARGEQVEAELDAMIRRRHDHRVRSEGERREMEAWQVTERLEAARKREENRAAWCEHWRKMRAVHYGLGDEYDAKLRGFENGHHHTEGAV